MYSTYINTRLIASAALSAIAALPLSVLATNRTIELSDTERVDIFDEPGSFTWTAPAALVGTAQILVVGGGGGDIPPTHPFAGEKTVYTLQVNNSREAPLSGATLALSLLTPDGTETPLQTIAIPDVKGFDAHVAPVEVVFPAAPKAQLRLRVQVAGKTVGQNFYDISTRTRKSVTAPIVPKRKALLLDTGVEENVKLTEALLKRFGWKGPANRAMKAAQAAGNIRFVMGSFKVKDDGELEFLNNCGCTVDADGNFEARAWLLDKEKFTDGGDFVFRIMDSNWSHVYAETRFHREKVVTNRKIIAQANETFKTLAGKKVKITLTADGKNVPADTRTPFATHWNEGGKTVWKQPFWRDMLPAGDFQNAKITNTILIEIPADATDIAFNLSDLAAPASVIYTDIHFEILP